MDSDTKFWLYIIYAIVIVCISLMLTIGGCCMHRNSLIARMSEAGIPPIEAQMAMRETEYGQADLIVAIKALTKDNKDR